MCFDYLYPYLNNIIETRSNDWINIFSSDENNVGIMISNSGGYFDDEIILSKATPYSIMKIDTAKVRNKRLNSYYDFDQNGFITNAVINKAKLPPEVVLKLIPKVINP